MSSMANRSVFERKSGGGWVAQRMQDPSPKTLRVCDRVHGELLLCPFLRHIATSPLLYRLDAVRQLGGCALVYPSATHTRREHSLGVCHLAGQMGKHLRAQYPDLVDDADILCLEVAGLVHDVGHGPFSHTFEKYIHQHDANWSHERMVRDLLRPVFVEAVRMFQPFQHGTAEQHFEFICTIVNGLDDRECMPGYDRIRRSESKRFLTEIVHNRVSGVDVDKWDYLCRDSLAVLGAGRPLNVSRLIHAARVICEEHSDRMVLAFDDSVSFEIAEMYALRARLHRQVYQHNAVLLIESLLVDLMNAIDGAVDEGAANEGAADGGPEAFHVRAGTTIGFASLTDAAVLNHPLVHNHPRVLPAFKALMNWTDMIQIPVTVVLRTLPVCALCGTDTELHAAFCARCGHSTKDRKGVRDTGSELLTAPECLLTEEGVVDAMGSMLGKSMVQRSGLRVHILDVQCGKRTFTADPHGNHWMDFDPLCRIKFLSKRGIVVRVESTAQHAPKVRHVRTARCYVTDGLPSTLRSLSEAFAAWGKTVGSAGDEHSALFGRAVSHMHQGAP